MRGLEFSADDLAGVAGAVEDAVPGVDEVGEGPRGERSIAAWEYAANLLRAEAERLRGGGAKDDTDHRRAYHQGYRHGLAGQPSREEKWALPVKRKAYSEGYKLGAEQRAHVAG